MDGSTKISKEWKTQHNKISAGGTVKYDFMTSLQNIAIAKIISFLWMDVETLKEIKDTFPNVHYYRDREDWKRVENSIVAKISHLHVPSALFRKMTDIVKELGESILNWISYNNRYIFCHQDSRYRVLDLMSNITWTARGKIDYKRTAKSIFVNEYAFLDDKTKCVLACNYCLEDEIESLAPKISEMFHYENGNSEPMVYFWMKHITGDLNSQNNSNRNPRHNNMSFNEYIMQLLLNKDAFRYVDEKWNDVPLIFMWNKLSEEEKERNVTLLVDKIKSKDCLFSFLSHLSYNLQQKIFKECYNRIFQSILNDWLWGEYFLPTTFIILESLEFCKPLYYWYVLADIIYLECIYREAVGKHMRDEYKSVFKRLWRETSRECKEYIIQYDGLDLMEYFLGSILSWGLDTDIAEVILEDLTAVRKKKIAFGEYGVYSCIKFIKKDRWYLLDSFLNHTLSTEEDIGCMKEKIMKDGNLKFLITFFKMWFVSLN